MVSVSSHAGPGSEKFALGWSSDGGAAAFVATNTNIPTAAGTVLPKGTAYITDVGMTGPYDSVIGVKKELVIEKFLTGMPARFEAANGDVRLCAVLVECDDRSGRATRMERLMLR